MSHPNDPNLGPDGEPLDLEHAGSFNNRHSLDQLSETANRKRAAVYADDWKNNSGLLSWHTKLFLAIVVLGGLIYGGLEAYDYVQRNPTAMDDILSGRAPTKVEETTAPAAKPPLNLRGKLVKEEEGIIGDTVVGGPYAVEIYDAAIIRKMEKGVSIVAVSGAVGNASKEPITSPPVTVILLEEDGSRHAASDQNGSYKTGLALNPKLCLNHTWGFVVPDKVKFTHVIFEFPDKLQVAIDLQQRTPENVAAIESAEKEALQNYMAALAEKTAARPVSNTLHTVPSSGGARSNTDTARLQKELAAIRDEWTANNDKCTQTQVDIEACMKALTKYDKQLKSMQDAVKRTKQEFDRDQATVNAAKQNVADLEANYPGGPTARATDRKETVYEARIQKAEVVLARAQRHMADSKENYEKKQKDQRELEESIKAEERNLQQLKSRFDSESRTLDTLEKRLKDTEEKLQEKQQASQFGA